MCKITFWALVLAAFTFTSCKEKTKTTASSTMVSSEELNPQKIDTLGNRYHELGRFSGSIFVAEEGEVVYQNFFGKADYETERAFSENTVFSLGSFSELIKNDAGEQIKSEVKMDSLEADSRKAVRALIEELSLKNTFLQKQTPKNAATGYIHNFGPNGPETQPIPQSTELQLWTNAQDLQKFIKTIADENFIQDGYSKTGGFNYAIRKSGDLNVIVLSNRRHPVAGEMAESIENLWRRSPYQLPLLRKETDISPSLLQDYAGSYELEPENDLKVITQNDSLFVLMGPQKVHLKPQSENQFFMNNSEAAIRFERDSTGNVASAVLLDGFLKGNSIPRK